MNSSRTKPLKAEPLETQTLPAQREHLTLNGTLSNSARVLDMLSRLCRDLVAAVDGGQPGADEQARLHGWLRADYFPWAGGLMLSLSLTARSELARVMAEIGRLDSALTCARGMHAAAIAANLEQVGTQFITEAVSDVSGTG